MAPTGKYSEVCEDALRGLKPVHHYSLFDPFREIRWQNRVVVAIQAWDQKGQPYCLVLGQKFGPTKGKHGRRLFHIKPVKPDEERAIRAIARSQLQGPINFW